MKSKTFDPIKLEIFKNLFSAIAEEMGAVLQKASYSPNIKERRDFSCALFDKDGNMIAQAAHIPVHLGAMPLSVQSAIQSLTFEPKDIVMLNHPFKGGTHLPDITLISAIFHQAEIVGYVANRAHHSDVGGIAPGSMAIAKEIYQEGVIIPPIKLAEKGNINQSVWDLFLANVRTPIERAGDLNAQISANFRGAKRYAELIEKNGIDEITAYGQHLLDYSEMLTRHLIDSLPNGNFSFTDSLDDDGISPNPISISVEISIDGDEATVDFSESDQQSLGSVNAVYAITLSAVFYVFRCLMQNDSPTNSGSLRPIQIIAPEGSIVNAKFPAPVAGGNVETSQRIVDVLLGALSKAIPDRIPAASQGTMNNTLIGGWDETKSKAFTYYETIGGGIGASKYQDGSDATHSHMTNTLNTPIEALEYAFPFQITEYSIRKNSGGKGKHAGGNGIVREIQVSIDAQLTLLTERRKGVPYGLNGGDAGENGNNFLVREKEKTKLPSKGSFDLKKGDIVRIETPGGGGFGKTISKQE